MVEHPQDVRAERGQGVARRAARRRRGGAEATTAEADNVPAVDEGEREVIEDVGGVAHPSQQQKRRPGPAPVEQLELHARLGFDQGQVVRGARGDDANIRRRRRRYCHGGGGLRWRRRRRGLTCGKQQEQRCRGRVASTGHREVVADRLGLTAGQWSLRPRGNCSDDDARHDTERPRFRRLYKYDVYGLSITRFIIGIRNSPLELPRSGGQI
jgi:hypothetical protein